MDNIEQFMSIYMYELEKILNSKKNDLMKVSFQSDEANTDRPLKEFLKNVIETQLTTINNTELKNINYSDKTVPIDMNLKKIIINKVLLPEDLDDNIKSLLRTDLSKNFTNPDLCLELFNGTNYSYTTIELKSTKNDSIPGSSIQQVKPNEWVIFIKHTTSNIIEITTGQYINAVNSKMEFPDRSPRPQVSFKELKNWNSKNRIIKNNSLIYIEDDSRVLKEELLTDWQKYLVDKWIDVLFSFDVKEREPWFSITLRRFIIQFLYRYDNLTEIEKENYKNKINELLKK